MLTKRMGSDPICLCVCVTIDAMINFDGDVDIHANTDVKCEQSITRTVNVTVFTSGTFDILTLRVNNTIGLNRTHF